MIQKICLVDWDGTLRKGYLTFDWLCFLHHQDIISEAPVISFRRCIDLYKNGVLDYQNLIDQATLIYASAISGLKADYLASKAADFVQEDKGKLFSFCKPLLLYLKSIGVEVVVISGAPTNLLREYAKILPLSKIFGVTVEVDDHAVYTGVVRTNYGNLSSKRQAVEKICDESTEIILAIGDSTFDTPLFDAAKFSFFITEENNGIAYPGITLVDPDRALKEIINQLEETSGNHSPV